MVVRGYIHDYFSSEGVARYSGRGVKDAVSCGCELNPRRAAGWQPAWQPAALGAGPS